ncbi:MAG: PKD domain-containing protein [Actinomycetota bacterium]|nr:PKD domain-containing protein [Actinomycetota bacterium]
MTINWRVVRGVAVGAALSASVSIAIGNRPSATASPTPVSPGVYVVGSVAGGATAEVDRFSLAAITGASSPLTASQKPDQPGGPFLAVAITPNASSAVLVRQAGGPATVSVLNVASGAISAPVALPGAGAGPVTAQVAADPVDSSKAFVAVKPGGLYRVDVGGRAPAATAIAANLPVTAQSIAVAPDGQTVYVGGSLPTSGADGIAAVTAAGATTVTWSQAGTGGVADLALSPDGRRLFCADRATVFGLALPLTPTAPMNPSVALPGATAVTVSPGGATVYAGGAPAGGQAFVAGFAVGSPNPVVSQNLQPSGPGSALSMAVAPDGATLVAAVGSPNAGTTLYPVPVNGGNPLPPGRAVSPPGGLHVAGGNEAVAIIPDQAPAASFVAQPQPAATASTFDATKSAATYGSITGYRWSFGDGANTATTGPTTAHAYAHAGTFTITVVETDSAGTSVPPAVAGTPFAVGGAGRTPYRLAATSAEATATITVPPARSPSTPATAPSSPAGPTGQAIPQLLVSPTVGPPGTIVTVTGTGFPANTTLTILWSTSSGSSVVTTDGAGNMATQLLVLAPDVLGPRFAIVASYPAAAPFVVVADSVEPGGSGASPIFRSESP